MSSLPPLIDAGTLAAHLDDPSLRIFETTVHLTRPPGVSRYTIVSGRADYEDGHIPGAAFADLPGELSDAGAPLRNTPLEPQRFAEAVGQLGIGPGTHVVVYSRSTPMWATRLWWLLRHAGFDAVSVLDGGFDAWRRAGLPLEQGPRSYAPARFQAAPRPQLLARRGDVEAVVSGQAEACLLNVLTPATFRGEDPGSAHRPGRIPGSVNVHWQTLLDDRGRFRPQAELEALLQPAGALDTPATIAYCGGGIAATVGLFALALLGRDGLDARTRLYDGSLNDWSSDPSLPLAVG